MAGTKMGGQKTAATNYRKYGTDFYRKMGSLGGAVKHPETRPFVVNRELARVAGAKGGRISRRRKSIYSGREN